MQPILDRTNRQNPYNRINPHQGAKPFQNPILEVWHAQTAGMGVASVVQAIVSPCRQFSPKLCEEAGVYSCVKGNSGVGRHGTLQSMTCLGKER